MTGLPAAAGSRSISRRGGLHLDLLEGLREPRGDIHRTTLRAEQRGHTRIADEHVAGRQRKHPGPNRPLPATSTGFRTEAAGPRMARSLSSRLRQEKRRRRASRLVEEITGEGVLPSPIREDGDAAGGARRLVGERQRHREQLVLTRHFDHTGLPEAGAQHSRKSPARCSRVREHRRRALGWSYLL